MAFCFLRACTPGSTARLAAEPQQHGQPTASIGIVRFCLPLRAPWNTDLVGMSAPSVGDLQQVVIGGCVVIVIGVDFSSLWALTHGSCWAKGWSSPVKPPLHLHTPS